MPISTPESWLTKYSNDKDHFKHVLEHFLIPSLEKADLKAISPITKGSELIHAEIIANIETADLVLCDISTLNPNVFFELGIRTALNKPVCLIKDDVTSKIPFDTASINHHEYLSALNAWELDKEIDALANHIEESQEKNNNTNSLWKYFSLSSTAHPVEPEKGTDGKIDYLTMQIEALRNELVAPTNYSKIIDRVFELADSAKASIAGHLITDGTLKIFIEREPAVKFVDGIEKLSWQHAMPIKLLNLSGETKYKFG